MKKIAIAVLLLALTVVPAFAADGWAAGVSLGYPRNGVAFSYAQKDFDVIGTVAWNFSGSGLLTAQLGANYDIAEIEIDRQNSIDVTAGVAATAGFAFDPFAFSLGAWVPFGLSYTFDSIPLEIFLRVGPTISILPEPLNINVDAALGILYHFE